MPAYNLTGTLIFRVGYRKTVKKRQKGAIVYAWLYHAATQSPEYDVLKPSAKR